MYRERRPPASLSGLVRCVWHAQESTTRLIVPDGCLDVIVTADRVFVAGPDTRAWRSTVPPGTAITGLRFEPGQAARVLGVPADALRNSRVDLAELWGRTGTSLAERLRAEPAALAQVFANRPIAPRDPEVTEVVARIDAGATRISTVIADVALSERQLRRRFRAAVGYGPATYLRVSRLRRAVAAAEHGGTLAEIAGEAGYADQPHLSRDCREFTGLSPAVFLGHG
ncbi:AraC-like DNA-binding protein [Actinoalloteichus hoggarensis]|uniref:Transcriptional activator FtrA n=1 Tax=Actinoalloteichus hoggarensis TaxID=1470176 RepID=A0A221W3K1_9PSEU|nr:helix-turn-helix transcriptional regulator [Actinoalloteichus hoggarensis]ASO20388.1 transcriptional activator FtrA [Actinoalloteichus hoggarensis]MBB5923426.1 AraC-like DNA-binding protein [Actinoalloteichus hoggarensis]